MAYNFVRNIEPQDNGSNKTDYYYNINGLSFNKLSCEHISLLDALVALVGSHSYNFHLYTMLCTSIHYPPFPRGVHLFVCTLLNNVSTTPHLLLSNNIVFCIHIFHNWIVGVVNQMLLLWIV